MTLIVVSTLQPIADLAGQANGQLSDAILSPIPGGRLVRVTARKWLALRAAAFAALGVDLRPTSQADAYRTLAQQISMFQSRYIPESVPGKQPPGTVNGSRKGPWLNRYWWKVIGNATAATPGHSNHGDARAIDAGVLIDGKVISITYDPDGPGPMLRVLDWLSAGRAMAYGFSWETVPEEPWHLHDWAGDNIPAAVMAYEHPNVPNPTPDPTPIPPIIPPSITPEFLMLIKFPNGLSAGEAAVLSFDGSTLAHISDGKTVALLSRGVVVVDLTDPAAVPYDEAAAEMRGLIGQAITCRGRRDVFALDPSVQAAWAARNPTPI